ncbi:MAG: dual OB domain-containing protein [Bacteroidales bacterium]
MEVLIISKTKMQNGICVGGISLDGEAVRLLDENGRPPSVDTDYEIRQVWTVSIKQPSHSRPLPHSEDSWVMTRALKGVLHAKISLLDVLNKRGVLIYRGAIANLFEGKLKLTKSGACFISGDSIPQNSVCFWIVDRDITRQSYGEKTKYNYNDGNHQGGYKLPYVGLVPPIETIPEGTLLRMSLANWWSPDDSEKKCYLQLSGWY